MLQIKNQIGKTAELYLSGNIVDDVEGGWISEFREKGTTGYEFPQKIKDKLKAVEDKELTVYINSYGGNVFAGVALANMIARRKNKTICVADGIVASIATQIFFMGDELKIPSNCYLMIHKPECVDYGNADDLRKTADTLDTIQRGLETTYQKKAKDGVTAEQITELVNQESWLTGQEASEYFNVQVLDAVKVVNCVGSAEKLKSLGYKRIPKNLTFNLGNEKDYFANTLSNKMASDKDLDDLLSKNQIETSQKIKIALARAKGALI